MDETTKVVYEELKDFRQYTRDQFQAINDKLDTHNKRQNRLELKVYGISAAIAYLMGKLPDFLNKFF